MAIYATISSSTNGALPTSSTATATTTTSAFTQKIAFFYQLEQSGMELMAQLEHDKAEAKRQKPKLNPSHVKIEGLLAHVPEPGSHNISFQQHQQRGGHRQHHRVSTAMGGRSPSPTPPTTRPASHIMMSMPPQQQPLISTPMAGAYNMYPYYAPFPQQQQQQQLHQPLPPQSTSPMDMTRR
ncbi:unnamed protein product [Absidia cylindrospora]